MSGGCASGGCECKRAYLRACSANSQIIVLEADGFVRALDSLLREDTEQVGICEWGCLKADIRSHCTAESARPRPGQALAMLSCARCRAMSIGEMGWESHRGSPPLLAYPHRVRVDHRRAPWTAVAHRRDDHFVQLLEWEHGAQASGE